MWAKCNECETVDNVHYIKGTPPDSKEIERLGPFCIPCRNFNKACLAVLGYTNVGVDS